MNPAILIPVYNHSRRLVEVIQNVRLRVCLVRHEKNQNKAEHVSHFRPWHDVLKNSSAFSRRIRDRLLSWVRR